MVLLGGPAAIYNHSRAGHQRRRVRGEEHDRAGDLVELAEAAELDAGQHLGLEGGVLEERAGQRRFQEGRADAVDADVVRRQLHRHGLGEAFHGVLGGAVDGAPRGADVSHLRGHVDDGAGLLGFDEPARDGLGDEVGGAHVEPHDGIEVVDGDVEQHFGPVGAGVVEQDVERVGLGIARCMAARSVTSRTRVSAFWPRARIAAAAASISEAVRAARVTWAPASASAPAADRPMPRPAPVMSARLPSRRKDGAVASSTMVSVPGIGGVVG